MSKTKAELAEELAELKGQLQAAQDENQRLISESNRAIQMLNEQHMQEYNAMRAQARKEMTLEIPLDMVRMIEERAILRHTLETSGSDRARHIAEKIQEMIPVR